MKDSTIYTPPINTPVLAGVARKTVCQIAVDKSVKLVEKDLCIDDLLGAEEVFLTNVIMQIMPVTAVEKHTVGEGSVGAMTKSLQMDYDEFIQDQCRKSK